MDVDEEESDIDSDSGSELEDGEELEEEVEDVDELPHNEVSDWDSYFLAAPGTQTPPGVIRRPLPMNQTDERAMIVRTICEGALSADPYYGVPATSLHRHILRRDLDDEDDASPLNPVNRRVEIRFWTNSVEGSVEGSEEGLQVDGGSGREGERRLPLRTLYPHSSPLIPGIVHETPGSAWRLLLIPHSGRVLVIVLDTGNASRVLVLVRFNPITKTSTVHELDLPKQIGLGSCLGLAVDDYAGLVSLLDRKGRMWLVPYA